VHWIVDAQLPPDLARWLEKRGHEAEHVEDVGLRNADDPVIWQRALQHNAVILTKDEDFVLLAATNPAAPVIVWLRLGNASTRALLGVARTATACHRIPLATRRETNRSSVKISRMGCVYRDGRELRLKGRMGRF
jgi:predicted nuclease of predicted toxin-antitoxin system